MSSFIKCGDGVLTQLVLTDEPALAGGFVVWLSSKERGWLNGRYVSATWDVEVLEGMRREIEKGDKLKLKLVV